MAPKRPTGVAREMFAGVKTCGIPDGESRNAPGRPAGIDPPDAKTITVRLSMQRFNRSLPSKTGGLVHAGKHLRVHKYKTLFYASRG